MSNIACNSSIFLTFLWILLSFFHETLSQYADATDGNFYVIYEDTLSINWVDANIYCQGNYGTTLASVTSASHNSAIASLRNSLSGNNEDCFIGFNDIEEEDVWEWLDGTPYTEGVDYDNWAPNQPNNFAAGHNCSEIYGESNNNEDRWNDIGCTGNSLSCFVCNVANPTSAPTNVPTEPTSVPSDIPSILPTIQPSQIPTILPTVLPTYEPSLHPTTSNPTSTPSTIPTIVPSLLPSGAPTLAPVSNVLVDVPTSSPTNEDGGVGTGDEGDEEDELQGLPATLDRVGLNTNSATFYFASLLFIFFVVSCLVNACAFCHKRVTQNGFKAYDDVKYMSVIFFGLQVFDFYSDVNFSVFLADKAAADDEYSVLFICSVIFLVVPWLYSIGFMFYMQKISWMGNAQASTWIRVHRKKLVFGTMLSGGFYCTMQLFNSRLFGMYVLDMGLSHRQTLFVAQRTVIVTALLENLPQIGIQVLYLVTSHESSDSVVAVILALVSSSVAFLLAVVSSIMNLLDDLKDEQVAITITVACKSTAEAKNLVKRFRLRGKIGEAISESMGMSDRHSIQIESQVFQVIGKKVICDCTVSIHHFSQKIEIKADGNDAYSAPVQRLVDAAHDGSLAENLQLILLSRGVKRMMRDTSKEVDIPITVEVKNIPSPDTKRNSFQNIEPHLKVTNARTAGTSVASLHSTTSVESTGTNSAVAMPYSKQPTELIDGVAVDLRNNTTSAHGHQNTQQQMQQQQRMAAMPSNYTFNTNAVNNANNAQIHNNNQMNNNQVIYNTPQQQNNGALMGETAMGYHATDTHTGLPMAQTDMNRRQRTQSNDSLYEADGRTKGGPAVEAHNKAALEMAKMRSLEGGGPGRPGAPGAAGEYSPPGVNRQGTSEVVIGINAAGGGPGGSIPGHYDTSSSESDHGGPGQTAGY